MMIFGLERVKSRHVLRVTKALKIGEGVLVREIAERNILITGLFII